MRCANVIFLILFSPLYGFTQLPSKVMRLEGIWEFKQGSGYESWELQGEDMVGHAFQVNSKTGDTSKMEDIRIRLINGRLVYMMNTYSVLEDSLVKTVHHFIGERRKMNFVNMNTHIPVKIRYRFGFFNRKKLNIMIYYGTNDKPVILILNKMRQNIKGKSEGMSESS